MLGFSAHARSVGLRPSRQEPRTPPSWPLADDHAPRTVISAQHQSAVQSPTKPLRVQSPFSSNHKHPHRQANNKGSTGGRSTRKPQRHPTTTVISIFAPQLLIGGKAFHIHAPPLAQLGPSPLAACGKLTLLSQCSGRPPGTQYPHNRATDRKMLFPLCSRPILPGSRAAWVDREPRGLGRRVGRLLLVAAGRIIPKDPLPPMAPWRMAALQHAPARRALTLSRPQTTTAAKPYGQVT